MQPLPKMHRIDGTFCFGVIVPKRSIVELVLLLMFLKSTQSLACFMFKRWPRIYLTQKEKRDWCIVGTEVTKTNPSLYT